MAKDFKLSDEVLELIIATRVADLEEFRFFFTKEDDIAPFLAKKGARGMLESVPEEPPGGTRWKNS